MPHVRNGRAAKTRRQESAKLRSSAVEVSKPVPVKKGKKNAS